MKAPRKKLHRIRVTDFDRHRNGITGAPFHVVLFSDLDDENTQKIAILFDTPRHCAVLDMAKLAQGSIGFGFNSYRGDKFEASLREALEFPQQSTTKGNAVMKTLTNTADLLDVLLDIKRLAEKSGDHEADPFTLLDLIAECARAAITAAKGDVK